MNWKLGLALTLLLSPALSAAGSLSSGFDDDEADPGGEDEEQEDIWPGSAPAYYEDDEDTLPPSWLNGVEDTGDMSMLLPSELDSDVITENDVNREETLPMQKRSQRRRRRSWKPARMFCFGMGMSCSASPHACCNNYYCRCNIFGSNCKCDRAGLLFG